MTATPPEIEGPFYPLQAQKDVDFDLTQIIGHKHQAAGEHIYINGSVVDMDGSPLTDATVEIWQANAVGRYRHPHERNTQPLDPHFQGWAIVQSGKHGRFRFKTVLPGSYPVRNDWTRPPHIHFKVSKRGYHEITTQMYFAGQPLNDTDLLLHSKTAAEQCMMVAQQGADHSDSLPVYKYTIVLKRIM